MNPYLLTLPYVFLLKSCVPYGPLNHIYAPELITKIQILAEDDDYWEYLFELVSMIQPCIFHYFMLTSKSLGPMSIETNVFIVHLVK
jgi:hypothetical protein